MLRIFLGNQIFGLFLLPLLVAGYLVLNLNTNYFEASGIIDLGFWGTYAQPDLPWIRYAAGGLVFINALLLNYLFNTNSFYERNSYIVSLLYVVLMSFYHSFYQLDGVLVAQIFLIFSLFQLFGLEYNLDGRKKAFNIGFLTGLAACFHPPLIFMLPLVWIMMTRIRPFVFREIVLSIAGFAVPLVYGFLTVYFQEHRIDLHFIETKLEYTQKELNFLISAGLFVSSALLSVVGIRIKNKKSSIRFRKLAVIIYLFLLSGLALGTVEVLLLKGQYEWFSLAMPALCLFLPFSFFNRSTEVFATVLFYATFLFSIAKFFI